MITPKEIKKATMNPEKKASARNDYFAYYVGRPISYVLTVPFLYTSMSPNLISLLSIIPLLVGFALFYSAQTKCYLYIGWLMYFIWNLLDGVDGNVARYKKQFSKMGSVFDAMSGYVAMVFTFFSAGIAAAHFNVSSINITPEMYIILGAFSGIFMIFPRLVMHKAISSAGDNKGVRAVKDKSNFGIFKVIILNLDSVTGGAQILLLIAIMTNLLEAYTILYFSLNFAIMIISLHSVLKKQNEE